jgi:spore maturation protein CgeB
LAGAVAYYLCHEDERQAIVDRARTLIVEGLTMQQSIQGILDEVTRVWDDRQRGTAGEGNPLVTFDSPGTVPGGD